MDFTQVFKMIAHDLMVWKRYFDGAKALLGECSTLRGIEYGVPQDFVPGPLVFISIIDDVSDLQIYHSLKLNPN
jgi:hypothetical protein